MDKETIKNVEALENFSLVLGICIGLFIGFWIGWYACVYLR
jgi:hypothetical protein